MKSQNHWDRQLKGDTWQEIKILLTRRVESSKGGVMKIRETGNLDLIIVVGWRAIVDH
jgi:hypothetical protein